MDTINTNEDTLALLRSPRGALILKRAIGHGIGECAAMLGAVLVNGEVPDGLSAAICPRQHGRAANPCGHILCLLVDALAHVHQSVRNGNAQAVRDWLAAHPAYADALGDS